MKQVTRSISRAIASPGTSMQTFHSFVRITRHRKTETLALRVRQVLRERRASEMNEQQVQLPIMRRRNSVNGPVAGVPVDQNFVAHLQELVARNDEHMEIERGNNANDGIEIQNDNVDRQESMEQGNDAYEIEQTNDANNGIEIQNDIVDRQEPQPPVARNGMFQPVSTLKKIIKFDSYFY